MSALPPPVHKTRALDEVGALNSGLMKFGISVGSVEPSASIMTMMSPRAAAKPQASALPLPLRSWRTIRASGRSACATSTVSSVEWPSTMISSLTPLGN